MHERFNFYDIYAYLFPGLTAIGLLAAPRLIAKGALPDAALAATIAVVLAGYALGHVLAEVGRCVPFLRERPLPHVRLARKGGLAPELQTLVAEGFKRRLHLDLESASETQIQEAFTFARNIAIQEGERGYFEQFQGLYGLMRGLSVATGLACVMYLGWGLAITLQFRPSSVAHALLGLTLAISSVAFILAIIARTVARSKRAETAKKRWNGARDWAFVAATIAASATYGWIGATHAQPMVSQGWPIVIASVVLAVLSERFSRSFKDQASNFARAVYHAFAIANLEPKMQSGVPDAPKP
jgi:hypothetical protein